MFLSVITQLQCSDHPLFSSLRNTYTFSWIYTFLTHHLALIFTLCAPFYLIYYVPSTTLHYCWRWLKDVSISALDNNSLMCNIELQQFRWDPETLSKYYIRYNNNTEPNGGEKVPKSLLRGLPEGNKLLWQPLDSHIWKHFPLLVEMPGFIGPYVCLKWSLCSGNLLKSDMSDIPKTLNTIQPLLVIPLPHQVFTCSSGLAAIWFAYLHRKMATFTSIPTYHLKLYWCHLQRKL